MLLMLTRYCLYCPNRAMVTFAMTYLGYDPLKVFSYAIFVDLVLYLLYSGTPVIRIGSALRGNMSKILQN